jgi:hypothetical protein
MSIHVLFRWSSTRFEYLIIFDLYQWPIWVDAKHVEVHKPMTIVYFRLHHRFTKVHAFSKKCQETATIRFHQSIISINILRLAMMEAKMYHCL